MKIDKYFNKKRHPNSELVIFTYQDYLDGIKNYQRKIDQLERDNRADSWYSLKELLVIFPDARSYLRYKVKQYQEQYDLLASEIEEDLSRIYNRKSDRFTTWFWKEVIKVFKGEALNELSKKIQEIKSALDPSKIKKGRITQNMIDRAKEYPFEHLVEANRARFALCPFHNEQKPSFYIKGNFGHCFGCGWSGDTIKFLMERDKINFKEAVRDLNN